MEQFLHGITDETWPVCVCVDRGLRRTASWGSKDSFTDGHAAAGPLQSPKYSSTPTFGPLQPSNFRKFRRAQCLPFTGSCPQVGAAALSGIMLCVLGKCSSSGFEHQRSMSGAVCVCQMDVLVICSIGK